MSAAAPRARARRGGAALTAGVVLVSLFGTATPASAAGLAPIVAQDSIVLVAGTTGVLDPLVNDSDPDGDQLSLAALGAVSPVGAGTATAAGSSVSIAASPGFLGTFTVGYTATDGSLTADGVILVTVTPVPNRPPIAVADSASMAAGAELRLDPRANDSDPDGDAILVSSVALATPGAGTATLEGQVVVVRSAAGFAGAMQIGYTLVDARGATATSTITVHVLAPAPNRPPIAVADSARVVSGRTIKVKVLANDSDPDGDRLTLGKVSKAAHGRATRSGSKVVFRAPRKYSGVVKVRYTVRDARGAKARGTLTIRVVKPRPAASPRPVVSTSRQSVESALARLGLPVGRADGSYDARTRRAVCAWRTITGRTAHRGLPTAGESRAIVAMGRLPRARSMMVTGVTISVTCQAAFWVGKDRQYRRVMAASTGKPGYRTRLGTHRIFITHRTWRYSTIYPEARMYKPMQFSGGQAMHGSATDALVRTYPASHGCVRMLHRDIDAMQAGGVGNGTLVRVIGRW